MRCIAKSVLSNSIIRRVNINGIKFLNTGFKHYEALVYDNHGDPTKVIQKITKDLPRVNENDVVVRMLAAPINPADINMIQGVYALLPDLPAIGGNEGVGEIVATGSQVRNLAEKDWVIPGYSGFGTWRTYAVCKAEDVIKVPNDIPVLMAATFAVNPCTAYRMLHDFVQLKPGDYIIQNGANSGVGQNVIQVAAELGVKTINIVRERPNIAELTATLTKYGATHVITDTFLRQREMKEFMMSLPQPKLALNCVGGKNVADILKYVAHRSVLVTYGGMSKQPLMIPTTSLIFKDIRVVGYWMTRWNKEHPSSSDRETMWNFLTNMIRNSKLTMPLHHGVPFDDFHSAIAKSVEQLTSEKQILTFG